MTGNRNALNTVIGTDIAAFTGAVNTGTIDAQIINVLNARLGAANADLATCAAKR